jgi:inositol-phosphate transport system ATP-binding protein
MAKVELRDVTKAWDKAVAVKDMNLVIQNGEFVSLLGPSGCGKSTTLLMLAGIYLPTKGDILFDGAIINEVEARERNVSIVFQSYALYPNMTALQNIMFPLRFQPNSRGEELAREMADLVQVGELLERKPSELSGGQQQRVALARALVKSPNLLLLDEPLSNLDASLRLTMRAEIKRITRKFNLTTVLVTHDQLEATTMSDRVIVMNEGQIQQIGTPENLYAQPNTLFVGSFIGSPPLNLIKGTVEDERLSKDHLFLQIYGADGEITLGVRPENLVVAETGIPGEVSHVEPMGREVLTTVHTAFGELWFLEAGVQPRWEMGNQIKLNCQPENTLVFDRTGIRIQGASAKFDT